jgi:hypothetical protein
MRTESASVDLRPCVRGKFIFAGDEKLYLCGTTYGTFCPDEQGMQLPSQLELPFLDFQCFNVYLETPEKLNIYLARLHNLCGEKPLVLAEIVPVGFANENGFALLCARFADHRRIRRWQTTPEIQGLDKILACRLGVFVFADLPRARREF